MRNYFKIFFLFIFFISCSGNNCKDLSQNFHSYSNAINVIQNSSFTFQDQADTSKSSWIKNAEYFSCDNNTGYLIITTKRKKYLFANVPVSLWKKFKQADSYGKFYNRYIRNKYQFTLK